MSKTVNLNIPTDSAERIRREDESAHKVRQRIVEVLRKYGVTIEDAPLDALASAMKRMIDANQ